MYRGKDLFLHQVPQSGFQYERELSWELACQWYGTYTREQFMELPGDAQARIVAVYLVHNRMDAVVAKANADEAKRRNGQ